MSSKTDNSLERDFCEGKLSLNAVANKYMITMKKLRYMAHKKGWVRAKRGVNNIIAPNGAHFDNENTYKPMSDSILEEWKNKIRDVEIDFNPADFGLTEKEALFVYGCIKTKSRVGAYRYAGYKTTENTAYVQSSRMYRKPKIAKAINELRSRIRKRYTADLDEIVDQLMAITRTDSNTLTQHRRLNCRFCWGEDHHYQWIDLQEFDKACEKSAREGKREPDYGGVGFSKRDDPNPMCPKCHGEGIGDVFIADTRDLSWEDRQILQCVKNTKGGVELIMEDKKAARQMLIQIITGTDQSVNKDSMPTNLSDFYADIGKA